MINMSYCRWENTYKALMECLSSDNPTSESEKDYMRKLFNEFLTMMEDIGVVDSVDWDELNLYLDNE